MIGMKILSVPVGTNITYQGRSLTVTETEAVILEDTIYCTDEQYQAIKTRLEFDQKVGEPGQ